MFYAYVLWGKGSKNYKSEVQEVTTTLMCYLCLCRVPSVRSHLLLSRSYADRPWEELIVLIHSQVNEGKLVS